jgi:hypothetical protein
MDWTGWAAWFFQQGSKGISAVFNEIVWHGSVARDHRKRDIKYTNEHSPEPQSFKKDEMQHRI